MPDWKKLVRKRLSKLGLPSDTVDDVFNELSLHLEETYEGAVSNGWTEARSARSRRLARSSHGNRTRQNRGTFHEPSHEKSLAPGSDHSLRSKRVSGGNSIHRTSTTRGVVRGKGNDFLLALARQPSTL